MRFRDALKFSLQLFLPERAALAIERFAIERTRQADPILHGQSASTTGEIGHSNNARKIIEDLDSNQFGGPSFGPQTIALMSRALEQAQASLPRPISDDCAVRSPHLF